MQSRDDAPADTEARDRKDPDIPAGEREKILSLMQKMMETGIYAVYGQEDEGLPDAHVDCGANLNRCGAICCTFQFALTKEEVRKGHLKHNLSRPFFIARGADGYCLHLERSTLGCTVWTERPLRCRRYGCGEAPQLPEDGKSS